MQPLHLTRLDPSRNMSRFYRLDLQPDLFGGVLLVREWGRIGRSGQSLATRYADLTTAIVDLEHCAARKLRRGYLSSVRP